MGEVAFDMELGALFVVPLDCSADNTDADLQRIEVSGMETALKPQAEPGRENTTGHPFGVGRFMFRLSNSDISFPTKSAASQEQSGPSPPNIPLFFFFHPPPCFLLGPSSYCATNAVFLFSS
jgi:hypothetical protein